MNNSVYNAIATIDKEINVLKNLKDGLENIDSSNLSDAEKWCIVRETTLRSDIQYMLQLTKQFIPEADEYIFGVNEIKLRFGRIIVSIPTKRSFKIVLSYDGMLVKKYPEQIPPSDRELHYLKHLNMLKNNCSTWEIVKHCTPNTNTIKRLFYFLFTGRKNLRDIDNVEKTYQIIKESREKRSYELLDAYTVFGNEVCRFDALIYDKVKSFAGSVFEIDRNGIYY
jgi:hypothetical protein